MAPDPLSATFAALADPTRRAILARLALGETSVMELAEPFDMSLPAVSKHLKVLENAGLILRGREAQWRPCRIAPVSFEQADRWIGGFRKFWEEAGNRLDDYLQEMKAEEAAKAASLKKSKIQSGKIQSGKIRSGKVQVKEKQRGPKSRQDT